MTSGDVSAGQSTSRSCLCRSQNPTEEKTYFHRALEALGGRTEVPLEPVTAAFRQLMDEVRAAQDYPLIAAVLCVAEWSYLGWASRAPEPLPESFVHREWIELHEGAEFRGWVAFLRGELDRLGAEMDEGRREEVLGVFRRAVELERAFFDMAAGQPDVAAGQPSTAVRSSIVR
jgi:thiaminase/transcriptional activator TenA